MANEYLQRTPTSTGNRRVFTWSGWYKRTSLGVNQNLFCSTTTGLISKLLFDTNNKLNYQNNSPSFNLVSTQQFRDVGNWIHILFAADTTASTESDRIKIYVNGSRITDFSTSTYPSINSNLIFNYGIGHWISKESADLNYYYGDMSDLFLIDGQALTPDVFGKYDEGKGYISAGTTQATNFKKGQWIPKAPAIIKSVINARGGFGVNGFYLPMNSANNYGADFHCTPNSILKLKENLPQPKAEIDGAGDYTNALRDDPFKDYLVLAIPGVSGGLQNGFGDYSAAIRGSGIAKTITNSNIVVENTASYYGSAIKIDGPTDGASTATGYMVVSSSSDFQFGTGDFTIETWVYGLDWTGGSANQDQVIYYHNEETSGFYVQAGFLKYYNVSVGNVIIGPTLVDQQWYHLAVVRNSGVLTLYVNGVAVGVASDTDDYGISAITIGKNSANNLNQFRGYLQDFRIYKGVAKYKGGFDVPKPYTPVGIETWRAVSDTCQNNFATLNPLLKLGSPIFSFSDGNLNVIESGNLGGQNLATMGVSSGKWYYEVRWAGIVSASHISGWSNFSEYNVDKSAWCRSGNGQTFGASGGGAGTFPVASNGNIINVAFDADSGKLWFGINGTYYSSQVSTTSLSEISQGNDPAVTISTTGSGIRYFPIIWYDNVAGAGKEQFVNFGQNPSIGGNYTPGTFTDSNGKGLFKYQPPTGFLALCEDNLPTPTIQNPGEHFKTILWTGDGRAGRSITGVGFQPDLVWIKQRNGANSHALIDSVRGPLKGLSSDSTAVENNFNHILSFNSDGFSVGISAQANESSSYNYVAWCWKAGGSAITNTDGTITSQVSVNQDAGFSIVSFTTPSSGSFTIGHGLNKTPKFIISKDRGATNNWHVWHGGIMTTSSQYLVLNSTNTLGNFTNVWGPNVPTSSVFGASVGSLVNANTASIAYCWTEIEGYSKFGSYVGNGDADGPFVYCGFKPAFLLIKLTAGEVRDWHIYDSARNSTNTVGLNLRPSSAAAEINEPGIDFLSNGFKIREGYLFSNLSGQTIVFAAFAESPFQTANAK